MNAPINETLDITNALRGAGMLADLSISTWGGTKSDSALLDDVKRQHGAVGEVGKVLKNLLAGHDDKLKAARSAYNSIRQRHYDMTLPWVSDPHAVRQSGPRLLTYPLFDPYMKEMSRLRRAAIDAKQAFVDGYPTDAAEAQRNLGTMASAIEYPTQDEVDKCFRLHFDVEPIPETASFRGLPDMALDGLRKNLEKKQARQIADATKAAWAETRARVEHLVQRLTTKDAEGKGAVFKETTVENVRELLTLLPGWNITGNPQVAEVVKDLNTVLDGVNAGNLRKDEGLRHTTAAQAQKVVDKLAGWGL